MSAPPRIHGRWWPSRKRMSAADFVREDNDVSRGLLGMSRKGKGEFLKKELVPALRKARRAFVIMDVHDEHSVHGKPRKRTSLGTVQHRVEAPKFKEWVRANLDLFQSSELELCIVPVSPDEDEEEIAEQILSVLSVLKLRGDLDVIFEECAVWASANKKTVLRLKAVATGWLKEGVRAWFVAQGYRFLPLEVRSQLGEVLSFCQVDSADVRFLGIDLGRGYAATVIRLARGECVVRRRDEADPELLASLTLAAIPADQKQGVAADGGEEVHDGRAGGRGRRRPPAGSGGGVRVERVPGGHAGDDHGEDGRAVE